MGFFGSMSLLIGFGLDESSNTSEIQFLNINALSTAYYSVVLKLNCLPPQPDWYYNRLLGSCRGFDPSTDDYLVTVISHDPNSFSYFSLNANTWKELESANLPYCVREDEEFGDSGLGWFFNGAIHWFAHPSGSPVDVIAVFDAERSVSEIGLPPDFDREIAFCRLRIFGEFLSICTAGCTWVMKEYKVRSSWSKRDIVVSNKQLLTQLDPIWCTKSGDIFGMEKYRKLVKFNDEGEVLDCGDLPEDHYGEDIYIPGDS